MEAIRDGIREDIGGELQETICLRILNELFDPKRRDAIQDKLKKEFWRSGLGKGYDCKDEEK